MPEHRTLTHVDTLRLAVKQPSTSATRSGSPLTSPLGSNSTARTRCWRTFRVGELLTGVVMAMEDADTLRAEVYADGPGSRLTVTG